MECCVEFITLISSEANDISEKEAKKTIACEHVEKALRDLGFADYIPDVLAVAEEHKEALKVRTFSYLVGWHCQNGTDQTLVLCYFRHERRKRIKSNRAV
jgi:hypothetical protein